MGAATTQALKQAVDRVRIWWDRAEGEDLGLASTAPMAEAYRGEEAARDLEQRARLAAFDHIWGEGRWDAYHTRDEDRWRRVLGLAPDQRLAWFGVRRRDVAQAAALRWSLAVQDYDWDDASALQPDGSPRAHVRDGPHWFLNANAPSLPFSAYDGALCIERLWRAPEPQRLINAMARALKTHGPAVVVEPVLDESVSLSQGIVRGEAARLTSIETWRQRFEAAGFAVRAMQETTGLAAARLTTSVERLAGEFDSVARGLIARPDGKHVVYALAHELDGALRRMHAIERGDMAVYRFTMTLSRPR